MYLQATLPQVQLQSTDGSGAQFRWLNWIGHNIIEYVEIEIGGQRIDKHYAHWLYIWNELSLPAAKREGYNQMVGAYGGQVNFATDASKSSINRTLYVPLEFWFCRNVGLALPLIALQYHEVKINLNFESIEKCTITGGDSGAKPTFTASLWVDYIFLDTDERRRFAQLSHEYLIEQLQFTGEEAINTTSVKAKLNFNHPCKELVWFLFNGDNDTNNWFNYTTKTNAIFAADGSLERYTKKLHYDGLTGNNSEVLYPTNPVTSAKLVLNGNDRFSARDGMYFNVVQPFQHHENVPANAGINVYSFALKPEEHQPSGTLNMSRIDTAVLNLDIFDKATQLGTNANNKYASSKASLFVYATNYNVLRILSGMGGLAYSN